MHKQYWKQKYIIIWFIKGNILYLKIYYWFLYKRKKEIKQKIERKIRQANKQVQMSHHV